MTQKLNSQVTDSMNFFQGHDPYELVKTYGSPLYVYNERIFRQCCRDMVELCNYHKFIVNYAVKANTNLSLLALAREEGLKVDVSSAGEIVTALAAGFKPEDIFFIANNISGDEMDFAVRQGIIVSVDSLSQLSTFGMRNPGEKIALRFNTGIGGGHHESVITGGYNTKFGIMEDEIDQAKELLKKHDLTIVGINHHIGSGPEDFIDLFCEGVESLLNIGAQFENLQFIDFGGGFPIPYAKQEGELPLDLALMGERLSRLISDHANKHGNKLTYIIEPGRYICAESGVLLGTVHSVKNNGVYNYAGTDIGFSVLARHTLYEAHHDIEVYRQSATEETQTALYNIVGNMCESGDYVAKGRKLPALQIGDILCVLDTGAYGYSMSSEYNMRPRPAEVLIETSGNVRLIRRRDSFEDMLKNMQGLS